MTEYGPPKSMVYLYLELHPQSGCCNICMQKGRIFNLKMGNQFYLFIWIYIYIYNGISCNVMECNGDVVVLKM